MTPEETRMMNPLQLAYMGDTVWELLVRSQAVARKLTVRHMHQAAVSGVNARAQAEALSRIVNELTEDEADVVRRGRNAHPHHAGPKHQDPADYKAATGLEALIGYLYLSGQEERMMTLFHLARQEENACPAQR
ncbi:MAG: Mini-ribonuclease 3 [Christensenellaceae bacterium]|nr:Mini-ribonuclease 3 [Christensenellaceae bacterium]